MLIPYSLTLVGIQFLCLGSLLFLGPLFPANPLLQILAFSMVALGGWAFLSMNRQTFRVFPEPGEDGQLVVHGPYQYIRHPMYTAVLGYGFSITADSFTLVKFVILMILTGDLVAKLNYEERLLEERFSTYHAYAERTARLVPFIY